METDEVLYITVLPLDAMLLPYTVKLAAAAVQANETLACLYRSGSEFILKLQPRFNYVYTPSPRLREKDMTEIFFAHVKAGAPEKARAFMTPELSGSIDDKSLIDFFSPFIDISPADAPGRYYMLGSDGEAKLFIFTLKNGLIDNISD